METARLKTDQAIPLSATMLYPFHGIENHGNYCHQMCVAARTIFVTVQAFYDLGHNGDENGCNGDAALRSVFNFWAGQVDIAETEQRIQKIIF